jgi:hypothetical protein
MQRNTLNSASTTLSFTSIIYFSDIICPKLLYSGAELFMGRVAPYNPKLISIKLTQAELI